MKVFELNLLSKWRTELMGISAIMILICHAPGNGIEMPTFMKYALVQGQIGVDVFLFLSGMGLWYSLSKLEITQEELKHWYFHRYIKLLVPYLIIQGFLTTVKCFQDETLGFLYWLSSLSTIEFWLSHRAAWFIALLLPLYLISPVLFTFFRVNSTVKMIFLLIITYFIALFPLDLIGMQANNYSLCYNIQFVMIRVPSFIVGMYLAPRIKNNESIKVGSFALMFIGAIVMFVLTRKPIDTYMFLVMPMMYILINILSLSQLSVFQKVCHFFGGISLESYLWNDLHIVIIPVMIYCNIPDYNNMLMYSLVLIVGTLMSILVSKMTKPIISKFTK